MMSFCENCYYLHEKTLQKLTFYYCISLSIVYEKNKKRISISIYSSTGDGCVLVADKAFWRYSRAICNICLTSALYWKIIQMKYLEKNYLMKLKISTSCSRIVYRAQHIISIFNYYILNLFIELKNLCFVP